MKLLNFSHPLTDEQQVQIKEQAGSFDLIHDELLYIASEFPLVPQIEEVINSIPLSQREWQTESILIVPPGLNFAAVTLLSELHGRMGHFPVMIRIKPTVEGISTRYEISELINLQTVRDQARESRKEK